MGSCLSSWSSVSDNCPSSPSSAASTPRWRRGSKRMTGSQNSSFNAQQEEEVQEELNKIPGRMFQNGSSNAASLFTMQGKKGTNQDAMIVWENFGSRADTIFCGVFDGHGPNGHMVAQSVRNALPQNIIANLEVNIENEEPKSSPGSEARNVETEETSPDPADNEPNDFEDEEKYPKIYKTLKAAFLKAFNVVDTELKAHPKINCFCSGSTAVTLVKQGRHVIIGNLGDSRAILGTREENNSLTAVQLTVDLKPNVPKEAERIRECRGRVFALRDEPDVARVWLPNNDSPGLAMARAFGDFCLKSYGLISVPEVTHLEITEKDEFIILATDGIWDVLSNNEVVDIIASAPTRSTAARFLVENAVRAWKLKYPTSKVDDCAVVCLFLNTDPSDNSPRFKTDETSEVQDESEEQDSSNAASLNRLTTVRSGTNIFQDVGNSIRSLSRSRSRKQPSDGNALDGVSRVDTMLTLPRLPAKQDPSKD